MKTKRLLIIIGIVFFLSIGITTLIYSNSIIKTDKVYTDLIITENKVSGFAIDKTNIRFGTMPPGNEAEREFDILTDIDVFVTIKVLGSISPHVIASENKFFMNAGESKRIKLTAYTPKGTPPGNYSGYIVVQYHKPWMQKFLS